MKLQSHFSFTLLIGQINLRKWEKLHIFISKNNISKSLGGFTTTFTSAIISSTPGQLLSLHKKCLVLTGMGGRVWWRATKSSVACTSIASHKNGAVTNPKCLFQWDNYYLYWYTLFTHGELPYAITTWASQLHILHSKRKSTP